MSDFNLEEIENNPSFVDVLLSLINNKSFKKVEVYNRAGISRQYFSKIICNKGHNPIKKTVLALGISMKLSLSEMELLLKSAGYSFSPSDGFDQAIKYLVSNKKFDMVLEVNPFLKDHNLTPFTLKKDETDASKKEEEE